MNNSVEIPTQWIERLKDYIEDSEKSLENEEYNEVSGIANHARLIGYCKSIEYFINKQ